MGSVSWCYNEILYDYIQAKYHPKEKIGRKNTDELKEYIFSRQKTFTKEDIFIIGSCTQSFIDYWYKRNTDILNAAIAAVAEIRDTFGIDKNDEPGSTVEEIYDLIPFINFSEYARRHDEDRISKDANFIINAIKSIYSPNGSIGCVSDGYHTYDELYHHRAILFAAIMKNLPPDKVWKSKHHDDPEFPMYEGMFICGVETPEGQATYHYDINPYWDLFDVQELDKAPPYDGHTPHDAIMRIAHMVNPNWKP